MEPPLPPRRLAAQTINTYHCHCTTLLLATTFSLPLLPRRRAPAEDEALILPLPPLPSSSPSPSPSPPLSPAEPTRRDPKGYTLLLSTSLAPRPVIVRRADGFEKRRLVRCGRCRVVVAYTLDPLHYATPTGDDEGGKGAAGRLVYLLPRALVGTEEMVVGGRGGADAEGGL
ncbi:MAG: hypothetical protein M1832_002137 [Thelocarpon impressellum]|nr:MAG: hypothetical protein M1832_002137 [Thelocarpon impressellum]